jgi:hypothetical protein
MNDLAEKLRGLHRLSPERAAILREFHQQADEAHERHLKAAFDKAKTMRPGLYRRKNVPEIYLLIDSDHRIWEAGPNPRFSDAEEVSPASGPLPGLVWTLERIA